MPQTHTSGARPTEASAADSDLRDKLELMRACLRGLGRVAVAFSGGVDSTFVLKVAVDALGAECVLAVTGVSGSVAAAEVEESKQLAERIGVRQVFIDPGEFEDPNYLSNPTNRCFYCKTALYSKMAVVMGEHGIQFAANGTNMDDLGDYRPGLSAAESHGVVSPCVVAGLTKREIRDLSRELGLPTHDKPAAPCLSSRVQYGEAITVEKLRMIERGEAFLRTLGVRECRVRHHDRLARIEVPADWIERLAEKETRVLINKYFSEIGYQYVTIDLTGFRSGSMNEVIAFGRRQKPVE